MNVVSLFAGCGGLDLGFERAGFDVVWANEFDETIHETYRINHPNTALNTCDIRTLSGADIPDCDGIIGGPPCQAWSEGGKGLGIKDSRGQLFFDYIRIVKEKLPKFFLIENVQGILDEKHKKTLGLFMETLRDAGYNITYELLNSARYKIPQDRFRVFFVGIRKELNINFQFPDEISPIPITLRQAIGDIIEKPRYFNENPVIEPNRQRENHDVYSGSYDSKYMSRNRVRSWNEPSFTMQAQARNAPQHPQAPKMIYLSPNQRCFAKGFENLYRRLSVRECARIQTFPDDFIFRYKDIKDGYKMVGNAVPPRLALKIAEQIQIAFSAQKYGRNAQGNRTNKGFDINQIALKYPNGILARIIPINDLNNGLKQHVLICLISPKYEDSFLSQTATLYYSGKRFPSAIKLDQLQYFVPYIKGKGVRDLYLIKIARIGSKCEIELDCLKTDYRIIFEIEFKKQLFNCYMPLHLNIWHTYTDSHLGTILQMNE